MAIIYHKCLLTSIITFNKNFKTLQIYDKLILCFTI